MKVEFSLILLSADGDGKLLSLLMLTELSLPTDLAELNPLELEVLFPRPCRQKRMKERNGKNEIGLLPFPCTGT